MSRWDRPSSMLKGMVILCIAFSLASRLGLAEGPAPFGSEATLEEATLTADERLFGLAMVWSEAKRCYPMWHRLPDLDWGGEFQRRLPEVVPDQSDLEYYRRLQSFAALMKDSHVKVSLPRQLGELLSTPPVRLWYLDGRFVVVAFALRPGATSPISLGDEVLSLGGVPVSRYAEENIIPFVAAPSTRAVWHTSASGLLRGPRGSEVAVRLRKPDGTEYVCHWDRTPATEGMRWVLYRPLFGGARVEHRLAAPGIGYIRIRDFGSKDVVKQFDDALEQLGGISGLIIDLRVNGGGNSGYSDRILRRVARQELPGMLEKRMLYSPALHSWGRGANGVGVVWEDHTMPALAPAEAGVSFQGDLVVLTSIATGSAAEDFVGPLKTAGRATVIGQSTFGSTGNPLFFPLPGGGSFRVCTRYMLLPDGTEFIGPGIHPDIEAEVNRDDVVAGSDPVLERAIAQLRK